MPIPSTRAELTDLVTSTFTKLRSELEGGEAGLEDHPCVDDWTVRDVLVVRAWWTERVSDWIEAGLRGESPVVPAEGYRWTDTPRLNSDLVSAAQKESYASVRARLDVGFARVCALIGRLDDRELLQPGVFPWAGKWPISRWISINTARQYATARTYVRKARRETGENLG